jgi:hypothetical protein
MISREDFNAIKRIEEEPLQLKEVEAFLLEKGGSLNLGDTRLILERVYDVEEGDTIIATGSFSAPSGASQSIEFNGSYGKMFKLHKLFIGNERRVHADFRGDCEDGEGYDGGEKSGIFLFFIGATISVIRPKGGLSNPNITI